MPTKLARGVPRSHCSDAYFFAVVSRGGIGHPNGPPLGPLRCAGGLETRAESRRAMRTESRFAFCAAVSSASISLNDESLAGPMIMHAAFIAESTR